MKGRSKRAPLKDTSNLYFENSPTISSRFTFLINDFTSLPIVNSNNGYFIPALRKTCSFNIKKCHRIGKKKEDKPSSVPQKEDTVKKKQQSFAARCASMIPYLLRESLLSGQKVLRSDLPSQGILPMCVFLEPRFFAQGSFLHPEYECMYY